MKRCASACGECRRCRLITQKLAQARKTASLLQQALLLLETVDWVLANDLQNYTAREIKEHPGLRTKLGFRLRIEKLTRQA